MESSRRVHSYSVVGIRPSAVARVMSGTRIGRWREDLLPRTHIMAERSVANDSRHLTLLCIPWRRGRSLVLDAISTCYTVASILRVLLNEDVVERLIRHEAQQSALSGLETTSEFNNSP